MAMKDKRGFGYPGNFGIVVIGASRGGLEAISTIARSLSPDLPIGVAAVLHTSADSPRILDEIIGSSAAMPVSYAKQDASILAGHIYIAPPDSHLIVRAPGTFGLEAGPKIRHLRPAADRLFESAAQIYQERVIGVVLTGDDGDGTVGLRAIHAVGGIGIIQDPNEAFDPSMPRSALQGDDPAFCVPLEDMGTLLTTLSHRLIAHADSHSGRL
jgi:two-component system chemotaxis response regulator CheB